ncbi:MAG: glycosyl hydrolase family 28 protein [Bacteroidota bacterium]|nr:glycosyl hydrolase family 28 protein [Bacteroidota bacterium]
MKQIVRMLLVIIIVFFTTLGAIAQKLVIHPASDSIPHNNDFTVKVRVPGGKWQDLFEYQAQVDMHNVRNTSMVNFDFEGSVEVSVTYNKGTIQTARIRPLSYDIHPQVKGKTLTFSLSKPCNLSLEVNGDIFHNLQIFTNPPETNRPDPKDTAVIYLAPGFHTFKNGVLNIPGGKTLYLAGGAVLKASISCINVKDVRICGRGIIYQANDGVGVNFSDNVQIEDLIFINPSHYTVCSGQSKNIKIKNIRSFSSKGWSDGIDLFCNTNVLIDGVFMRNSDDCIAIYCHRWKFYGDCRNVTVRNSTLWADVAHPILLGTHGNPEPGKEETIENISFSNIDILNQDELQLDYQGCMSINVSDGNLARNIRFEDIRVDDFERGQLVNLRVAYNKKYAKAPGRGIENVYFKNITYNGNRANTSIIQGYDDSRTIKNVVFENLTINGTVISSQTVKPGYMQLADLANIFVGTHVEGVEFRAVNDKPEVDTAK